MYRSGAHTYHLSQDIEVITAHTPEVVILQIGGNDFYNSGAEKQDHLEVANNIIRLAFEIRSHPSVQVVYIGKLFYRQNNRRYLPTRAHVQRYNKKVDYVNDRLQSATHSLLPRHIYVRNHKGRQQMQDEILLPDGTHLNHVGTKKITNLCEERSLTVKCY